MKKCILFVLLLGLCLSLWGCPADLENLIQGAEVHITAGKIEPGMTAKDIFVEVTVNNQPVPCRVSLTGYAWDGYWDMEDDEPVPENFYVCLNVFYSVPKGYEVEDLNITADADGGKYDGTGCISVDAEGNDEAWSRIFYGEEPLPESVHPVHVKVVEFAPGMTVNQIKVEVTVDGQPVETRVSATHHSSEGMRDMDNTEVIPDNALVRLNIYYYLDYGITLDNIEVTMDFPDGEYDGTGSMADHPDGRVEAWSHAFYDSRVETPTETEEPTTEPTTEATTAPATQTHVHKWEEGVSAPTFVHCTQDTLITYACTCGQTKTETITAPGHDFGDKSVEPATCTYAGRETWHCKRCGAGYINELPATGHTWSDWAKKTGLVHARTCSVCGAEEEASHNIPSGSVTCTDCGADIIN